jgi:hypothetical protein
MARVFITLLDRDRSQDLIVNIGTRDGVLSADSRGERKQRVCITERICWVYKNGGFST